MQAGSLNFNFVKKLVMVVTFMCAHGPAPHVARGQKHCKRMASLYKHMGKLQRAGCIVEPYNASRQPKFQFCQKVGNGRHVYVRAWPRPSRSAWAETLQTHGFPVQTWGNFKELGA